EKYTTQTCSCCGDMSSSLSGRAGLRIREWTCATCGTRHDRDINASKNILAVGLNRLVEGIPSL
ncbi:MAG: transposase, partial [Moraxella sp.]|nr:transposase [Moraxella sp.]